MRLFVKICGIMDIPSGRAAVNAGADAVGFVFHRPSRRRLTSEEAGTIGRGLPAGVARVGVFVDAALDEIAATVAAAGLTHVQLHGEEGPKFSRSLRRKTGCRIIKALKVGPDGVASADAWRSGDADFFLLDTEVPGAPGGTGCTFDWLAVALAALPAPVIVAGGLDPGNVAEALAAARPAGVDVSSGVESEGAKDAKKIHDFVAAVRRWEDGQRAEAVNR